MKNHPDLYLMIWKAVNGVRKGRVATYGQIAQICGLRGHARLRAETKGRNHSGVQARLVGYALHNLPPNSGIPWHRIVNSRGMISLPTHTGGYYRQKKLLEAEGIVFKDGKIDLSRYGAEGRARKAHSAKRGPARKKKPK